MAISELRVIIIVNPLKARDCFQFLARIPETQEAGYTLLVPLFDEKEVIIIHFLTQFR
jgi:hypothetical protein